MPVYKGSNEVSSGNLKKGSTNIENGYKQTDQFYVNTNAIIINFVDAISGATMNTTQFSSTGTPGSSFTPFTRTITTDSGRIFQGTVTVAESGDTGSNVSASISGQGSTTATLNVSGTHPSSGVTVTLTVNGATQVQLPNLNVSVSQSQATFSTSDSSNLDTFNYTLTQSASGGGANPSCSGGTSPTSGTFTSATASYNYPGFNAGFAGGGDFGNGCGVTCTTTVSASKSGYNSGSGSHSETGSFPQASYQCYSSASQPSTVLQRSIYDYATSPDCNNNYPATKAVSGSVTCYALQNLTIGCSNCIYSTGKTGPSQSVSCPSVPANGSSTDASAICPSPTGSGGNLSGGNLQLSPGNVSGGSWIYVDIGTIQVTYNTNQDNVFQPAGFVSMTCTANGQSHTVNNRYISSSDLGVPGSQNATGTTNFNTTLSDWPLFLPSYFGLSSFSSTAMSCSATLPLSSSSYTNSHTISGSGSWTVN
tara:strand:+ start:120 stop:1556 length:1437 start_codon:yes stop_codon:yes gene_type:complete